MASGDADDDLTPDPTPNERELASIGAEQWNDYQKRYTGPGGVNEAFINSTRATDAKRAAAAGQVGADAAIARRDLSMANSGVNLGKGVSSASGRAIAGKQNDDLALASAEGEGKGLAVQSVDNAQLAADFKLASFGRGLSDTSQVGLQQGVREATDKTITDMKNRVADKNRQMQGVGTGLGMYTQRKGWIA